MPSTRKRVAARSVVVLLLLGAVAFAFRPTGTPRAPGGRYACDAVWVGPSGGHWDSARNWSTGHVPNATQRACVAPSRSVVFDRGDLRAGSVEIGGRLTITGGTLQLMDRTRTSELGELEIAHGVLAVHGRLELAWQFYWGPGAHVAGPGFVDLGTASVSDLAGGEGATLPGGAPTLAKVARDALPALPKSLDSPPCGPYSPPFSQACATRDKAAIAATRVVWAKLAAIAGSDGSPEPAARLLDPGMCRPTCAALVAKLRAWARRYRPVEADLDQVLVVGDHAIAGTFHRGRVKLLRTPGGWVVDGFTLKPKG